MKRISMAVLCGIVITVMVCGYVSAQLKEDKAPVNAGNRVCPVMGTPVEPGKSLTVEHEGVLYNVCCPTCVDVFRNDPYKYIAIVKNQMRKPWQEK
ncbi:MAG: hypothetical protein V1682_07610 [Candidatus Omnitrophota bacterium]